MPRIAILVAALLLLAQAPVAATEIPVAHSLTVSAYFEEASQIGRPGEAMASDEPVPTCYPSAQRSTWFSVRSTIAGFLQVIVYADQEGDLLATSLYRGSSFADLVELDCDTDPQPFSLGVTAHMDAGDLLYVQVIADGSYAVRPTIYPTGTSTWIDSFASAEQLAEGYVFYGWTTEQATVEPGEPLPCGGTRTVWAKFVPERTGIVTLMALATHNDVLALYRGTSLESLELVGCAELNTYQVSGSFSTSKELRLSASLERGVTYHVQVAMREGAGSAFATAVHYQPVSTHDSPESAQQLLDQGETVLDTTVGAFTRPLSFMCPYIYGTVWYRLTPEVSGTLEVTIDSQPTTARRNFAPAVAIHVAGTGEVLGCAANNFITVTQSASVDAGTEYLIAASSWGFPGDYRLHWAVR